MRLFGFSGGVHPEANKQGTSDLPIIRLPMPARLYVPLLQHRGETAHPRVQVGDPVLKGQLLGVGVGGISAPVHSPACGVVTEIADYPAPHPSGLPVKTVVIETEDRDEWVDLPEPPEDPFGMDPDELAERVDAAGIVGMGGAAFPAAVKLGLVNDNPIHTLIINGSECEPYLSCDDRLMRERPEQVIDGARLMRHSLDAKQVLIGIEDNKPAGLAAMRAAAKPFDDVKIIKLPSRYPMGSEKHLIKVLTGREVPARKLAAAVGISVHNVATVYAVYQAIRRGWPLVARAVTVAGGAIKHPRNLVVPLGARLSDLLEYCEGFDGEPARLLLGGPMMGQVVPDLAVPVVKGTSGFLALTAEEIDDGPERPCIRCGRCVTACPVGLMPLELARRAHQADLEGAADFGLDECIGCGCCAYVCPSKIPLVHYFNFAKGELASQRESHRMMDRTKKLALAKTDRLERIKEERRRVREARKKKSEDKK